MQIGVYDFALHHTIHALEIQLSRIIQVCLMYNMVSKFVFLIITFSQGVYEALEREPKLWTYLVSYYSNTKQSEILMNCWSMFAQDIKVNEVSQIKRLNPDLTSEAFAAQLDAIQFN